MPASCCVRGLGSSRTQSAGTSFPHDTTIHDIYTAHQAVEHDGVNVLCLGGRVIGSEVAAEIVAAFLRASISDEDRHVRRRARVQEIERTGGVDERE